MPRLPDYTALGETPTPQPAGGVVGYNPPDRRQVGAGLLAAGRDVEDMANMATASAQRSKEEAERAAREAAALVKQANERQDVMVAQAAVNRLQAQGLELEAGEGGFQSVMGGGVVGQKFVDGYQQKFNDVATQIEQGLTNDNQRRLYQQRAPVAALQFRSGLLRHQATQTAKFNEQTETDTVDLARRQIFANPLDPQAQSAGLVQIDWAIRRRGERLGWNEETVRDTQETFRAKVLEDVAVLMGERDPAGTLLAVRRRMGTDGTNEPPSASGIAAIDALPPDKLASLHARLTSYVSQAQNRLRAEAEKRDREAREVTEKLQSHVLTGQMVSPTQEQDIMRTVAGTAQEPLARALIISSYAGAQHGSLTLPQQIQQLRALDARVAQQGSSFMEKELIDKARQITTAQAAEYKENPWAAATRFNRQPPVPEAQITSADQVPKLVAERLPLMIGVENAAGAAVSPLQPGEAKAFAEKLKPLTSDQRAETLGQTGAMLSAPRASALADQLDKHDRPLALALKMGLDRTTAGRASSALVLHGAQALADKTVKKDDSALAGWRAEIAALVRGTLGDNAAESDVIDAAYFIRAAQDVQGIGGPNFRSGIGNGAEDALSFVLGKPLERAGVKTFMPMGVKTEGDFDLRLRQFTPERLREMAPSGEVYVRGQPVKVEQLSNRITQYGLRFAGRGRYVPVANNAPFTLDAAGRVPLVLEVVR